MSYPVTTNIMNWLSLAVCVSWVWLLFAQSVGHKEKLERSEQEEARKLFLNVSEHKNKKSHYNVQAL